MARLLESRGPLLHGRAGLEKLPADYRLIQQTFTSLSGELLRRGISSVSIGKADAPLATSVWVSSEGLA